MKFEIPQRIKEELKRDGELEEVRIYAVNGNGAEELIANLPLTAVTRRFGKNAKEDSNEREE